MLVKRAATPFKSRIKYVSRVVWPVRWYYKWASLIQCYCHLNPPLRIIATGEPQLPTWEIDHLPVPINA